MQMTWPVSEEHLRKLCVEALHDAQLTEHFSNHTSFDPREVKLADVVMILLKVLASAENAVLGHSKGSYEESVERIHWLRDAIAEAREFIKKDKQDV